MSNFNPQRLVNLEQTDFTGDKFKKCLEDIEHERGKDFVNSFVNKSAIAMLNLMRQLERNVDKKDYIIRTFNSFDQLKLEHFKILLQSRDFGALSEMAKSNNIANLRLGLSRYLLESSEEKIETLFVMICSIV